MSEREGSPQRAASPGGRAAAPSDGPVRERGASAVPAAAAAGEQAGADGAADEAGRSEYRRIVVGVDGSPVSRQALVWAAEEAALRGCQLDVVYGWQVSTEPRPPGVGLGVAPPLEAYQRQAAEKIEQIVRETLGPEPQLRYAVHAVHRTPGRALVEQSQDADLLVLGTKGHGRLAAWLLGSIADEAMHRAPCSVVIVRPPPDPPAEE
jgi:nucleotide-binding universal stress UspA family protein